MTARQSNLLGALVLALGDRLREATEGESGHGGQAAAALAILAQQAGLGIEGLRQQVGLSQPATVRLVDRLAAEGLLVRAPGPDRRSLELKLTRAGRLRADAVLSARRGVLDEALKSLAASERAVLEGLLVDVLGQFTTDRGEAEVICRLCDLGACRLSSCPVECALD
jgi:DNA-binding MarR family transcriptional regulator